MDPKVKKWLYIVLAWAIILVGVVLMPLPGPGLFIVAGGVYLLISKSRRARAQAEQGMSLLRRHWPEGHRKLERTKKDALRKRRRLRERLRR